MAVSFEEYLRRGAQDPQLRGRETEDLRNALQAISSYQRNVDVGRSLGIESTGKTEGGALRRFMGVLERPALAARAGALKAVGFRDPRLARYRNPLEAAAAGARGELRITGGDIFRTRRDDNPLERAAKLAGAFTFDVATDPITYVGTPAALGRKTAATLAFREGDRAINTAAQALAKQTGRRSDEIVDELYSRSFELSDVGRLLKSEDPTTVAYVKELRDKAGNAAVQRAREAGTALNEQQVFDRAAQVAERSWRNSVAADQFGNSIATSLYTSGRRGLRGDLTEFLGSREAAEEVFASLPERVRGGLYFTNPITGQQIARVTSGSGDLLGPVADWGNKMRIYAATIGGRGTQFISGNRGKAWQKVREAAKASAKRGDSGFDVFGAYENTIGNYVREKQIARQAANVANRSVKEARFVIGEAAALRPEDATSWDDAVRRAFFGQSVPDDAPADALRIAQDARNVIGRAAQRMRDAGIDVPDAGPGYIPLMLTDEGRVAMRAQREAAGVGGGRVRSVLDPTRSRGFGEIVVDSAEAAAELGFDFNDNVIRLNPTQANLYMYGRQLADLAAGDEQILARVRKYVDGLGAVPETTEQVLKDVGGMFGARNVDLSKVVPKMFDEDPVRLMARYASSAATRTETQIIVNMGLRAGILTRAQVDTVTEIGGGAAGFAGALRTVNDRVFEAVQSNPKLARLVDPQTGVMSEAELASVGLITPSKMAEMIEGLQVNRAVPDTEAARKEFEGLVSQWFRLSSLREAGTQMDLADTRALERIERGLGEIMEGLDEADEAFRSLDGIHMRLRNQYGLSDDEIRELSRTVSEAMEDIDLITRRRLAPVSGQMDVSIRVGEGDEAVSVALLDVSRDLKTFILDDPQMSSVIDDARLKSIVDSFFRTRQIASEADQLAALSGLRVVGTGEDVGPDVMLPQALRMLRARSGVKELLEARSRVVSNPDELQKFWNDVYDPAFQIWKAGATSLRGPGYTFLNMMGNLWHNYLGDISIAAHKESQKVLAAVSAAYKQANDELAAKTGRRLTALEARATLGRRADEILEETLAGQMVGDRTMLQAVQDFMEAGGVDSAQIKDALDTAGVAGAGLTPEQLRRGTLGLVDEELSRAARGVRSVADRFLNNRVSGAVNSINTDIETWTRFATYLDTYRATGSVDAAMDRVFLLHFNYADLSAGDMMLRRIFPFYVWSRNNIPAQIRALFMQPGKVRRLLAAQEGMKSQLIADEEDSWLQEVLPDYIAEVEGFATRMKSGPHNLAIASKLPFDDVDRIFQLGGSFGMKLNSREIAQSLGPQITFPLEIAFQRDFSTGGAFDPLGREATGWRRPLGYIPGIGRVGPRGERRISEVLDKTISELLPPIGTAERVLSGAAAGTRAAGGPEALARLLEAPTPQFMRERGMSNLLNISGVSPLFGVSATTLAPRTISSALRERRKRQLSDIGQAAGRAGVSVDWIRQRLDEGYTPEEIALLIQQGEGSIEEFEASQAERGRGPSERTQGLLDLLRD